MIAALALVAALAAQDPPPSPALLTLRPAELARARARLQRGDAALRPALDQLLVEADSALRAGPFSVMDKQRVPPSGDRHDYTSLGPYWWPDSSRPNGLPYIRRDGRRNPETQLDYDAPRLHRMAGAVNTLTLAYHFTGKADYARHAARLLRTWFLDSATRMNPNLEYAQAIPGVAPGRAAGIIETREFPRLLDALALLDGSPDWTAADRQGMREWMGAFLDWLLTSRIGQEEAAATNNHGSWYDVQTTALALFVDRPELARRIVEASKTRRIARQIEPDGSQPRELARTRSLDYSVFNLEALMQLAELGRQVGVDLWHYEAPPPRGGSIRKALDYLAPYADPAKRWPHEQITPVSPGRLLFALRMGELAYGDGAYGALLAGVPPRVARTSRVQLLYPGP
ncbi:MAG TPA: alginate lyase family protein [Gemmatimonadales bacterium]|nr:alginate lyase family protein [Gemmatimonadales bacterium]